MRAVLSQFTSSPDVGGSELSSNSSEGVLVRLNGLIQTDDRQALREITRQLRLEERTAAKQFGSFAGRLISFICLFSPVYTMQFFMQLLAINYHATQLQAAAIGLHEQLLSSLDLLLVGKFPSYRRFKAILSQLRFWPF